MALPAGLTPHPPLLWASPSATGLEEGAPWTPGCPAKEDEPLGEETPPSQPLLEILVCKAAVVTAPALSGG